MRIAEKHSSADTGATIEGERGRECARRSSDPMDMVSLNGDRVRDSAGKELGRIEGVMLDGSRNRIAYAVLSLDAVLGGNAKLFAVPWSALRLNPEDACVVLDIAKERLKAAPAFDRDSWPSITDPAWRNEIDAYYGVGPGRK